MVDREVVLAKLAELRHRIERVRRRRTDDAAALCRDQDALDVVSFNLMLAVQSCADMASHVIADEGWPAALTLAESFVRLRERGVIGIESERALCR